LEEEENFCSIFTWVSSPLDKNVTEVRPRASLPSSSALVLNSYPTKKIALVNREQKKMKRLFFYKLIGA
jgi:hypothetical protein